MRMLLVFAIAVFGMIYERFSHGVYSNYMIYAFFIPFVLSLMPAVIHCLTGRVRISDTAKTLWDCGVAFLTVGCIFRGVLDIYGTSNAKLVLYPIIGAGLILAAIISDVASRIAVRKGSYFLQLLWYNMLSLLFITIQR